ncbi:hypothetical protein GMLC_44020 [Geomonas limicola]|uniref:DUF4382 domain-containing protein n=1 Tax=Geomonas limicola TaxID=2740186 RepID=A0A6V8NGQ4_9BACT|nr:DUF4382 domain-containing protein [Geomonas limicola]GFO70823.1 hypothetical protein GMLC_44020 [Geomonas limicola]
MKNVGKLAWLCLALLSLTLYLGGCSGGGSTASSSATGVVKLDVTDAPASDYAHVYVTVTALGFHTSSSAGFTGYSSARMAGWQVVRLAQPQTVDLAQLANGTMYADTNGNSSLFNNITLPVGRYQQLRIFLASTEDAYVGSIPGLTYNNEVVLANDSTEYALRVPTADEGIRVIPEAPVEVTAGGNTALALDFNLNNDVLKLPASQSSTGSTEFLLKPRLGYFDMATVGAITGTVSFGNLSTSRIVVKAEQVKPNGSYRVVRRLTGVDKTTGAFTLYPLPIFGSATTAVYDVLIRGRYAETSIVKGITVHKGSTPATGVNLGTITLTPGTEFTAQLSSAMHPSGAWINFYQTIAGDSVPFEVRYRHLNPYTGKFSTSVELSTGPLHVASYSAGQPLVFTDDNTSQGSFSVVADAGGLYGRGRMHNGVSGSSGQAVSVTMVSAESPQVTLPAQSGQITGIFDMTLMGTGTGHGMGGGMRNLGAPTQGQLFVTHGGMVIDSLGVLTGDTTVSSAMQAGGGAGHAVALANLPSGVSGAVYGMYALGWGSGKLVAGSARGIDLSGGNATATLTMK